MMRPTRQNGVVTIADVASVAGVHGATASRALNPETRALVNERTAQRVLEAAEALGYLPNRAARAVSTGWSQTVGVVVPDICRPPFAALVRGIHDRLEEDGFAMLLANTDADPTRERAALEALLSRQVDAFLTCASGGSERVGTCQVLARDCCPTGLAIPGDAAGRRPARSVGRAAAELLLKHLATTRRNDMHEAVTEFSIEAVHPQPERADEMPYAPAIEVSGAGTILFLSGATASPLYHAHPHRPEEHVLPDDIAEQTRRCLRSIQSVLAVRGLTWRHVVKVTKYLTDMREADVMHTVLNQHFGDHRPASTLVCVNNLSSPGARVELDMIAVGPVEARPRV
jgi:2-iminobutanoate/2-iminopropanoate deaminase